MSTVIQTTGQTGIQLGNGPSVMGERKVSIPIGGKIRGGIKRLTAAMAKNPVAVDIYRRGIAAGAGYPAIEKRIIEKLGVKYPLTPQNVPYFSARRADFAMPEVADRIMDLYAEDKGDGRHLYSLSIILAADTWLTNMPHGLKCYTASQLQYWSEYGRDGSRYCQMRAAAELDPQNKRARRTFGGRQIILRPENDGLCVPDSCNEYQAGKCKVSGGLMFYIPGVPGSSAIEMPTTSLYGMQQLRQQMEMVAFLRGGKISGTLDGKPFFRLTKKLTEVSRIDDQGKPTKVKQWLPFLEADLPMDKVFEQQEQQYRITAGEQAASALIGQGQGAALDALEPEIIDAPLDESSEIEQVAQTEILKAVHAIGLTDDAFKAYAEDRWGSDWSTDLSIMAEIQHEITTYETDFVAAVSGFDIPF